MENFIEQYENALSEDLCSKIIEWFEESPHIQVQGNTINDSGIEVVNLELKDSVDIPVIFSEEEEVSKIIFSSLMECLQQYKQKYPVLDNCISLWNLSDNFNIQKYYPKGGYHREHCETGCAGIDRMMAWMLYLNTVDDKGGTEFPSYDLTIKAEVGKMVIWPAYWTHTHKGVSSPTETKYIATGWFEFIKE